MKPVEKEPHTITITLQIPKGMVVDENFIRDLTINAQMDVDMWVVRANLSRHYAEFAKQLVVAHSNSKKR